MKLQFFLILLILIFNLIFLSCLFPPPSQYTLTVNVTGNGSVSLDPDQDTYNDGTEVELTANAHAGYVFDHWEGDLSGTVNPTTIMMDGDKSVTAVFVEYITFVGDYNTSGARGVYVSGDYAYVADDENGLVILEINLP